MTAHSAGAPPGRRVLRLRDVVRGVVALATLAVRVAIVALLDRALPGAWPLAILVAGAGGSFCVNFVLSKWVVFAPEGERA